MTATIVLLLCWAALLIAGDTSTGRFMRCVMVVKPAAAANRLEPGHVALAIVITLLVVLHASAGDGDPIRMVALFAPDMALWLASIELGTLVEASIGLVAALAALRTAVRSAFALRLPRHPKNKVNRARSGPRRHRSLPANDDEDGARFAYAN
jgi:hypothetical protein